IEEHDSVLFGTSSFWEGVDVPGKSLEFLVITKLPFEVPSDPVVEARFELMKEEGKNPFMEYMLPEAIIKLKQGMGRLIRSKSDIGVVLITDPRIITKPYSRIIRNSLPVKIKTFNDDKTMFSFIKGWFERVGKDVGV
ncbi:MAG: helicase, partial [Calditrichia bacterium]|nr:helicase [Calditrichia bacterium]